MQNQFQDLEHIIVRIKKSFHQNPNRSISALFRRWRKYRFISLIGDYPLLWTIVNTGLLTKANITRQKVRYAFNQSEELREFQNEDKTELLDYLIKPSSVVTKDGKK